MAAAAGLGLLHRYRSLQSRMHPFSLPCVIVCQEEAAHQVPPHAFNPLVPTLMLSTRSARAGQAPHLP